MFAFDIWVSKLLPDHVPRLIPSAVLSEIVLNITLFPLWASDLTRPWWSFLAATDASPAFGYGMCTAPCHPSISRSIGAASADPFAVVRLSRVQGDADEIQRSGFEHRLQMTMDDFKPIFSVQAADIAHAGEMEMEAVKLCMLRLTRCPRNHSHRGVILVDAQAVGFALRKGRSSAGSFRFGVAAIAALSLTADVKIAYPYLPSESNPADFPSRGKLRVRSIKKRIGKPCKSSFEKHVRAFRKAARSWRHGHAEVF